MSPDRRFSPQFETLPNMPGEGPELRMVGGQWMDREQYRAECWHIAGEYVNDNGPQFLWRATLAGLHAYAQLRREQKSQRHELWLARDQADQEFRDYVDALLDAKPAGRP